MQVDVFKSTGLGSDIRNKLLSVFEIKDETDKMMSFHELLKSCGNEVLLQNQILFLEKKFKQLTLHFDSLNYQKRHLIYLMEAYDFSKKEKVIPGQLKLFELLPEVVDKDLDNLADLKKKIARLDKKREEILNDLMKL